MMHNTPNSNTTPPHRFDPHDSLIDAGIVLPTSGEVAFPEVCTAWWHWWLTSLAQPFGAALSVRDMPTARRLEEFLIDSVALLARSATGTQRANPHSPVPAYDVHLRVALGPAPASVDTTAAHQLIITADGFPGSLSAAQIWLDAAPSNPAGGWHYSTLAPPQDLAAIPGLVDTLGLKDTYFLPVESPVGTTLYVAHRSATGIRYVDIDAPAPTSAVGKYTYQLSALSTAAETGAHLDTDHVSREHHQSAAQSVYFLVRTILGELDTCRWISTVLPVCPSAVTDDHANTHQPWAPFYAAGQRWRPLTELQDYIADRNRTRFGDSPLADAGSAHEATDARAMLAETSWVSVSPDPGWLWTLRTPWHPSFAPMDALRFCLRVSLGSRLGDLAGDPDATPPAGGDDPATLLRSSLTRAGAIITYHRASEKGDLFLDGVVAPDSLVTDPAFLESLRAKIGEHTPIELHFDDASSLATLRGMYGDLIAMTAIKGEEPWGSVGSVRPAAAPAGT